MGLWQEAAAFLSEGLEAASSNELVTFIQEGQSNSEITASFGKSEFQTIGDQGQLLEVIAEDLLLDTAALTLNGVVVKPKKGAKLIRVLPSGETVTYEVSQPDKTMRPYKLSCQDLRMRIHLKRVANG